MNSQSQPRTVLLLSWLTEYPPSSPSTPTQHVTAEEERWDRVKTVFEVSKHLSVEIQVILQPYMELTRTKLLFPFMGYLYILTVCYGKPQAKKTMDAFYASYQCNLDFSHVI